MVCGCAFVAKAEVLTFQPALFTPVNEECEAASTVLVRYEVLVSVVVGPSFSTKLVDVIGAKVYVGVEICSNGLTVVVLVIVEVLLIVVVGSGCRVSAGGAESATGVTGTVLATVAMAKDAPLLGVLPSQLVTPSETW